MFARAYLHMMQAQVLQHAHHLREDKINCVKRSRNHDFTECSAPAHQHVLKLGLNRIFLSMSLLIELYYLRCQGLAAVRPCFFRERKSESFKSCKTFVVLHLGQATSVRNLFARNSVQKFEMAICEMSKTYIIRKIKRQAAKNVFQPHLSARSSGT